MAQSHRPLFVLPPMGRSYYFRMLACLVEFSVSQGNLPVIQQLKLSGCLTSSTHDYSPETEELTELFLDCLEAEYGNRILILRDWEVTRSVTQTNFSPKPHFLKDILEIDAIPMSLRRSIYSTASTAFLSADEYLPFHTIEPFAIDAISVYNKTLYSCELAIANCEPDSIILFNGRSADQTAVLDMAKNVGLKWFCMERNTNPDSGFYFEDFMIQDRISFQQYVQSLKERSSDEEYREIIEWADSHLILQAGSIDYNPFLKSDSKSVDHENLESKNLVPVFLSSLDEDLGAPGFEVAGLNTLLERTIIICNSLADLGFKPLIVIHPNSLNKSWNDLSLLYEKLSSSKLLTVWPWDLVSSYTLLNKCKFFLTWRSSLGLEGMAMGKKCFLLTDSYYDIVTDAERLFEVNSKSFSSDTTGPNQEMAKFCLYAINNRINLYKNMEENVRVCLFITSLDSRVQQRVSTGRVFKRINLGLRFLFRNSSLTPKEFLRFFQFLYLGPLGNAMIQRKLSEMNRKATPKSAT